MLGNADGLDPIMAIIVYYYSVIMLFKWIGRHFKSTESCVTLFKSLV